MNNKIYRFIFSTLFSIFIFSCSQNIIKTDFELSERLRFELNSLSSVDELRINYEKDVQSNVDFNISYEFAQIWLDNAISRGEYSTNAALLDQPIPIYSKDGKIKYYEFIVTEYGKCAGYITAIATKDLDTPILFDSTFSGHFEDLDKILDFLAPNLDNYIIRLVDDGYPSMLFGISRKLENSDTIEFEKFYDVTNLHEVSSNDIRYICNYNETLNFLPDLILNSSDEVKVKSLDENKSYDIQAFWELAEKNKGNIAPKYKSKTFKAKFGFPKRKEVDYNNIKKTLLLTNSPEHVANYGACGPVSEGFVLDYLQANAKVYTRWSNLTLVEKMHTLYDKLYTGMSYVKDVIDTIGQDGDSLTLPNDMGNALIEYSDYKLKMNFTAYPKSSINNNLPGISLRTLSDGGMHYRNVIAYKLVGWGPFTWPSIKILDLIDSKNLQDGSWETFIPYYHLINWDVVKK